MKFGASWIPDDLPHLSPEVFHFHLWNADNSWIMNSRPPHGWIPIGWTNNSELRVRPLNDGIAVMFEYEGEEFWQHIISYENDL
ncbi:MAG: hypothetical protein DRP42_06780 [Tenericutes bacterium]|nr:MAG: hypothetical protein DRP42_06780 [Mycoplasmatota bacterium]